MRLLFRFPGFYSRPAPDTPLIPRVAYAAALPALAVEDGLTQHTVSCMYQDRRGFMWFGTQDGLNGYAFTPYRNDPARQPARKCGAPCSKTDQVLSCANSGENGLYLLQVTTGNGTLTKKLVTRRQDTIFFTCFTLKKSLSFAWERLFSV